MAREAKRQPNSRHAPGLVPGWLNPWPNAQKLHMYHTLVAILHLAGDPRYAVKHTV
jgi:hypothetical protein